VCLHLQADQRRRATIAYVVVAGAAVQIRTDRPCTQAYSSTVTAWTTLREWMRRRPGLDALSQRHPPMFPTECASRVPAEYRSLHAYLEHRHAGVVVLTFEQIESLLGVALPAPASTQRDWWMDAAVRTNRHTEAWLDAGRTAAPNLSARTVTFERVP